MSRHSYNIWAKFFRSEIWLKKRKKVFYLNDGIGHRMSFQVKEPILVVGLGGAGSKLAVQAKDIVNSDCLIISNDQKDLQVECQTIRVSTDSVVNPSVQLIRGSTYKVFEDIKSTISKYSTVIIMANLAGISCSSISHVLY